MFWKALFGSSHWFSLIRCWKVPPSCVSIIYLNKDAHWLLPHATSGRQLTTLQIISLICACLLLHSSHQPAEVPAVKWDHTAGQAQHLSSGLTGEKHMHTKHTDRTLTVRPTIEISFTGICVCCQMLQHWCCLLPNWESSHTQEFEILVLDCQRRQKKPNRLFIQRPM